ncbi:hypothetical protein [Thermoflexibacter ruber]|uniref:Uncharacterized protein n=1 Tax=Thermoflexibacter ruber TaxID=1003 RepID=A0A1I2JEY6_9BACT|nr:hypothetical protein [Thermoflexibacter ruber]SFF51737.1 hypothetical protein SAMN04488541_104611 [Thermoflexibacter ruber]
MIKYLIKKYLVRSVIFFSLFCFFACAYSPNTAWTPRRSKVWRKRGPLPPEKKVRRLTMWK